MTFLKNSFDLLQCTELEETLSVTSPTTPTGWQGEGGPAGRAGPAVLFCAGSQPPDPGSPLPHGATGLHEKHTDLGLSGTDLSWLSPCIWAHGTVPGAWQGLSNAGSTDA